MRIVYTKLIYFDKQDKDKFRKWMKEKELNVSILSKQVNISPATLTAMIYGQRALTQPVIDLLESLGYKLRVGKKRYETKRRK